ncbi:hypothetical protein D3C87_1828680 [compost metagenome]
MIDRLVLPAAPLASGARCQIYLAADNRLDSMLAACFIKRDRPVHDAVIGQRQRLHPVLAGPAGQIADSRSSVQ